MSVVGQPILGTESPEVRGEKNEPLDRLPSFWETFLLRLELLLRPENVLKIWLVCTIYITAAIFICLETQRYMQGVPTMTQWILGNREYDERIKRQMHIMKGHTLGIYKGLGGRGTPATFGRHDQDL